MSEATPRLSVVVPVFNEEDILESAVRALTEKLDAAGWTYELILAENGSTDRTAAMADALARELPHLRVLHGDAPNYGRALRNGIESARGELVVCDEIDLGDLDFYRHAIAELERGADLVVGSKRHPDSRDRRPLVRRAGTTVINGMLRVTLGFRGTDTHGPKAFRRARLLPTVSHCVVEHDLFASELVLRAGREGLDVRELPLDLREIRPPSVGLVRRVPRVLRNRARLVVAIRLGGPP